jgi:uncharacterized protein DUF6894
MKKFYFNTENDHTELDPDGTECANADQARSEALVLLGELMRDVYRASSWNGTPWKVWVTDGPQGGGQVLFTVELSAS